MHTYLHNGVASWEVALCLDAVRKETGGTVFRDAALASGWTGPKCSKHIYASYVRGLWSEKRFAEGLYKGEASQTESLVPLLRYYLEEAGFESPSLQGNLDSYRCLANCCAELRKLRYQWHDVTEEDVAPLNRWQELHQKSFVACYSVAEVKPKHHHRFHLGQAFLQMKVALRCEVHESKHRSYKHGLAERMSSTVHDGFQKSVLPRLLQSQANRINELGVEPVQMVKPFCEASSALQSLCGDATLQTAKAFSLHHSTVNKGDDLHRWWQRRCGP